ncbi:MAG: hypothetical protein U9R38_08380 [Candidatus Margulisiibacteriota bacterium]|nr:hypothetical protein [Candidatus Margulisiibacteriota bacterium]
MDGIQSNMVRIQAMAAMQNTANIQQREQVKDEFMAIFYKEMLKQAFKGPKFGLDEENPSFMGTYGSDMLVEKLAMQLAQSKAFAAGNILPKVAERNGIND